MLLDSCFESYQPYPALDQYHYSQSSCPPSPLSYPPSPSFHSPSPSPFPSSANVFQFPPAPNNAISSNIKEEPLPWKVQTFEPSTPSSPVHTSPNPSPSPSPLLSQASTPHNFYSSHPDFYFPDTIRSSNSSIPSYSTSNASPYYFHSQVPGTFGHSLASFHHYPSTNMEVTSFPHYHPVSPHGSGYSSPEPHLTTDVFHPSSQYNHSVTPMQKQIGISSPVSSPYHSLSPATTNPHRPECGDPDSKILIKEESGEEDLSFNCRWRECGQVCSDKNQLVEHINMKHIQHKKGCEEYPCYWGSCPRRWKPFNAKYKLLTHIRVHTGEKPFCCKADGCKRSFARLENLKIHNRSHTGEKPFLCKYHQLCSKAFSNSSDRAKHEQTHKDPKPYRCEVFGCQKRYTDPSSLRKHVKNHTKEEQDQVKQVKDYSKTRSKDCSQEGWLEIESLPSGNMGLLSGGGVVAQYDTIYRGQMEEYDQSSYGWSRGEDNVEEQGKRREGQDTFNYPSTPLYLEV